MTEKFHLFYGGILSQWYPCKFKIDDVEYNCAEQYMMYRKASLFDTSLINKIMASNSPREQKAYGRKVKNFNVDTWNFWAKDIVYLGNLAKFGQNDDLYSFLKNTDGYELVEASPYDKVWGIGRSINDPLAYDRNSWLGTNWLGETLTRVRDTLMNFEANNAT